MKKIKMDMFRSGVIEGVLTPPEEIIKAAQNFEGQYLPLTIEHDIRNPPIGRIISADVVVLNDGTHVLQGEAEIFEESDTADSLPNHHKSININSEEISTFLVFGNQTFEGDKDTADLYEELRNLSCMDSNQVYREDSIEPLSLLIVAAGVFSLQGIANGFFSKLGEDLYILLKSKLKSIYERKPLENEDNILQFKFYVKSQAEKTIEVNVVITNPTQDDLDGFFYYVPTMLDNWLSSLPIDEFDLCRLVVNYKCPQLKLLYALRSDGVPISITFHPAEKLGEEVDDS